MPIVEEYDSVKVPSQNLTIKDVFPTFAAPINNCTRKF